MSEQKVKSSQSIQSNTAAANEKMARSIPEFCVAYGLSRAYFYILKKRSMAPAVTSVGGRQLIMAEDERNWVATMRAANAADQGVAA